jgi:hypothetical protein
MDNRLFLDDGSWLDMAFQTSIFDIHHAVGEVESCAADDTDDLLCRLCSRVSKYSLYDVIQQRSAIISHLETVADPCGAEAYALTTLLVACHASIPACLRV